MNIKKVIMEISPQKEDNPGGLIKIVIVTIEDGKSSHVFRRVLHDTEVLLRLSRFMGISARHIEKHFEPIEQAEESLIKEFPPGAKVEIRSDPVTITKTKPNPSRVGELIRGIMLKGSKKDE